MGMGIGNTTGGVAVSHYRQDDRENFRYLQESCVQYCRRVE